MFTRLQLNGTEGTAICRVTVVNETNGGENMKPLQGCIVSSQDENLKYLIGLWKNLSDDQNIFSKHKYFFYSPNGEIITKQMKTTVSFPKTGDSTHHEKQYELERNLNAVVVNECHFFLLCESKELDKCSFLKKHRINGIRLNQILGNEVYGLGKDHLGFIKLKIEKCEDQPTSNEYKVQNLSNDEFKNLLDVPGPIIVVEHEEKNKKKKERKTLVGSFVKVTGKSHRISCSVFEVPDRTTDRLGTSTKGPKVDRDSDSENKGGNEPSENADNFDGYNPKSDMAKVNSSLEDVDDEIKIDGRGKNMKETSKFSSPNSYVWRELDLIQQKQQLNEKLEDKRQLQKELNEKQEENKRQLQKEMNEKQEENKRQLQKEMNEKQEEDKRQLQKQLNQKQEEDKRQLQEQMNKKQEEDKRQLQKQLNERQEEDKRQLQKQLNEKQEEDKRQLQEQMNEKQEEDKRQLQKQLNEKQEEDKRQLQKQMNEKQEEDKRQLQKQLNEKQEEDKRQLQKQLNEKQEEDKRQLQKQLNEKQEEDKRQLQKQLNEKQEEDKRQLQKQLNEKQEKNQRKLEMFLILFAIYVTITQVLFF